MKTLIKNCKIINEGDLYVSDILIKDQFIDKIAKNINDSTATIIDAKGKYAMPGVIDDQVHFREPGLTHKGDIASESRAAVAGGVTSFMEMPNVKPPSITIKDLEKKYAIASKNSVANYSFYMGATNDNFKELMKVDPKNHCGVKIFMGSSTGNMLVNDEKTIRKIFAESPVLVAIHSEDDRIIAKNLQEAMLEYGQNIPFELHSDIRSVEACLEMTKFAISIAEEHDTKLHILHITTEEELALFDNSIALKDKRITAEACSHHLWFDRDDYEEYGSLIKCNPAIKEYRHKKALLKAVLDDRIDVIASDHAPHTIAEKSNQYLAAPSGIPLVQHSLAIMLELSKQGKILLDHVVEKMCHNPAILFQIEKRGFLREGYYADVVLFDLNHEWKVSPDNILYKCEWSPFEGKKFTSKVTDTFVSGNHVYSDGQIISDEAGMRLQFER